MKKVTSLASWIGGGAGKVIHINDALEYFSSELNLTSA